METRIKTSILFLFIAFNLFATNYYVSNSGDDNNLGTSEIEAWETLSKIRNYGFYTGFNAGDSILLESGSVFEDYINVYSSGSELSPIIITSYGTGDMPEIRGYGEIDGWTVPGDWSEYATDVWRFALSDDRNRMWINGDEEKESETLTLTDNYPWRWESSYLYVKSSGNPATTLTSLITGNVSYSGVFTDDDNIIIVNINFTGGNTALFAYNVTNFTVKNCSIGYRTHQYGLRVIADVGDSSYNVTINDNVFDSNDTLYYDYYRGRTGGAATEDGLYVGDGTINAYVYNNYITGWGHSGLALRAGDETLPYENISAHNNYIECPYLAYGRGFGCDIGTQSANVKAYENVIYNTPTRSQANGTSFDFYNNVIDIVRGAPFPEKANTAQGLGVETYSESSRDMNIYNNLISNCIDEGIQILIATDSIVDVEFDNNYLVDNDTTNSYQIQTYPSTFTQRITYTDNYFMDGIETDLIYYKSSGGVAVSEFNALSGTDNDVISGNEIATLSPEYYYSTFTSRTMSFPSQRWTDINGNTYDHNLTLSTFESVVIVSKVNVSGNVFNYGGEWWKTSDGKIWNFNKTE